MEHSMMNYAYNSSKELVHIDTVPNGINCNCTCVSCGGRLIANQGKIKEHYFSHESAEECKTGYQTSIHLLAKEIFEEDKELFLPKNNDYTDEDDIIFQRHIKLIEKITLDKVECEKRIDNIIPDIIGYKNDIPVLVEIYVTHKVDTDKLQKIKDINYSAIEIDLSDVERDITKDTLRELLKDRSRIKWVWNKNWITSKRDAWIELTHEDVGYCKNAGQCDYCRHCHGIVEKNDYERNYYCDNDIIKNLVYKNKELNQLWNNKQKDLNKVEQKERNEIESVKTPYKNKIKELTKDFSDRLKLLEEEKKQIDNKIRSLYNYLEREKKLIFDEGNKHSANVREKYIKQYADINDKYEQLRSVIINKYK